MKCLQQNVLHRNQSSPRRLRPLSEIYESCNYSYVEPEYFDVAVKEQVWIDAIEEKIRMIEKNNTWELVTCSKNIEVISVK